MNMSHNEDFERLRFSYINRIITEPSFTDEEVAKTLRLLKQNKDEDFYHFLRTQRPEAKAVKIYLEGLKRCTTDRVTEEEKAKKHFNSSKIQKFKGLFAK